MADTVSIGRPGSKHEWTAKLRRFERPNAGKAIVQLLDTLLPYLGILFVMYMLTSRGLDSWIVVALGLPAGALLLRLFVIFHDCVHGSFFRSRRANAILGNVLGILTYTAFAEWSLSHGIHHSTAGNLDRRGIGDVWTMTVDEYIQSSRTRRLLYRAARNPVVLFGLGPLGVFVLANRVPGRGSRRRQALSVLFTDLVIAALAVASSLAFGIRAYLLVQLPSLYVMGVGAVWFFYIHHQFDPSYWARSSEWVSTEAALRGSSYYLLPKALGWISAHIGLHHVHHLRPRIPNYHLEQCVEEVRQLQLQAPLTLGASFSAVRLNLWDEEKKQLVRFRDVRPLLKKRT